MTVNEAIKLVKEITGMSLDWDDAHYDALQMAIKALEKQDRIAQILDDYDLLDTWEVLGMIKEVMKE